MNKGIPRAPQTKARSDRVGAGMFKELPLYLCHYWSQAYNLTQPWYPSPPRPPPAPYHSTYI
ncbi:hypothetical protein J6590_007931 [Homalodisca vitripennis]|nr:hypothetical protein J6590_007931 [Homalodisca vitripennis]